MTNTIATTTVKVKTILGHQRHLGSVIKVSSQNSLLVTGPHALMGDSEIAVGINMIPV